MMNPRAKAEHIVQEFVAGQSRPPLAIAKCSPEVWEFLCSEMALPELSRRTGPGHPFELDNSQTAAFASLAGALLADNLCQQFMIQEVSTKRVPAVAKAVFIRFAMQTYTKASKYTIKERIRVRRKDIFSGGLGRFYEKPMRRQSLRANDDTIVLQDIEANACYVDSITTYSYRREHACILVGTVGKNRTQTIQVFSVRNVSHES